MPIGRIIYTNHLNDVFHMSFTDHTAWDNTRRHLLKLQKARVVNLDEAFWAFKGYASSLAAIEDIAFTIFHEEG